MTTGTDLAGLETAVETVVLPAVQAHGLVLVDLEVRGNGRRTAVRVYVDKTGASRSPTARRCPTSSVT